MNKMIHTQDMITERELGMVLLAFIFFLFIIWYLVAKYTRRDEENGNTER